MTDAQRQIIALLEQIRDGGGGGAAAWGGITGTLADQTDLANALAAKVSNAAYSEDWDDDTTVAPSKNAVRDKIEAVVASIPAAPYLVYTALLTQDTTNDPVPVVLKNDLLPVVWTRAGAGEYQGFLAGAFPQDRTFVQVTNGKNVNDPATDGIIVSGFRYTDDAVIIHAYSAAGSLSDLNVTQVQRPLSIEIRVYPAP